MMSSSLPVNLIRQWCYCPRVVYYQEILKSPIHRPTWVKQGEDFHSLEEKLWQRRNLSRFNLKKGKKYYQLSLKNSSLGLHGIVDMAIETKNAVYAIEFKLSTFRKKRKDILQLVAYAMLLEKHFQKPSSIGFLVGKGKILHSIPINNKQKEEVLKITKTIKSSLEKGLKPDSDANIFQCSACEYLNFCNDRL